MSTQSMIVAILRREYEQAVEHHRKAVCEQAASIASANAWDQYHKDDGVGSWSQNPYNLNAVNANEMNTRNFLGRIKAAYDLAVDTFVEKAGTQSA